MIDFSMSGLDCLLEVIGWGRMKVEEEESATQELVVDVDVLLVSTYSLMVSVESLLDAAVAVDSDFDYSTRRQDFGHFLLFSSRSSRA